MKRLLVCRRRQFTPLDGLALRRSRETLRRSTSLTNQVATAPASSRLFRTLLSLALLDWLYRPRTLLLLR